MNKVLKVKCPTCDTEFNYYSSEFRPFCSERCKMVDLGHWASESYSVAGKPADPDEVLKAYEEKLKEKLDNENGDH
ncbi:MAG: DNA gyrase inhibitor YacG [Bacteriovoracaceae bacterium]